VAGLKGGVGPIAATDTRFTHRIAQHDDIPVLKTLMAASIRELLRDFLPPKAVEASFEVMGLDTRLIDDGTYYVVECVGVIAGCGGWSRRNTLFGGDHTAARNDALLDPRTDAARVRAMYTSPPFAQILPLPPPARAHALRAGGGSGRICACRARGHARWRAALSRLRL